MRPDKSLWRAQSCLFPPLPRALGLDHLLACIEAVWPLAPKRRRELPAAIGELSRLLTSERGKMGAYWSHPSFISAYLYYFLPWNVLRLGRLFRGLNLPTPRLPLPLLLDAGSGPLTLPIALWLACPDLRELPIIVRALDSARQPMRLGQGILEALAGRQQQKPWAVQSYAGPLEALGRFGKDGQPWLIGAVNVLNEGAERKRSRLTGEERMASLLDAWSPLWRQANPFLLFVEPGTRLGASQIANMRSAAIAAGFSPLVPCVHSGRCPMNGRDSWCHFVFSADGAPQWLKDISRAARLFKTSLSMAPLLLRKEARVPGQKSLVCRVISQEFAVNGVPCRYACSQSGLALLENCTNLSPGTLCLADANSIGKDQKSGACILKPAPAPLL